jgi:Nucleotide modification associated domain 2
VRLFSYKVRYDIGFAPNPFHGACTLATCKPGIRKTAEVGDWVVGVGSITASRAGHLVYAMEVEEKLTFDGYWADPRFQLKKAERRGSLKYRYGDNVYHRGADGKWRQSDCRHSSAAGEPNADHIRRDTRADAVLIASRFTYWGGEGPKLPGKFTNWDGVDLSDPGRDYTYKAYPPEMVEAFVAWASQLPTGYQGPPADW